MMLVTLAPSFFVNVELKILDLRMYSQKPVAPLGAVVIAAIDDHSIAELGRWPWPRRVLADLIDVLTRDHARVVCFDMLLSDPDYSESSAVDVPGQSNRGKAWSKNDVALSDAIRRNGSVFIGMPFKLSEQREEAGKLQGYLETAFPEIPSAYAMVRLNSDDNIRRARSYLPPLELFRQSARGIGFVNIEPDQDSIVRSEPMAIEFQQRYYAPLDLAVVAAYYDNSALLLRHDNQGKLLALVARRQIPLDEYGGMLIRFRGERGTFPTYAVSDIIRERVPSAALADKIVVVGASATGLGDVKSTPLDSDEPGVEIHATAIDDILHGDFLVRSMLGIRETFFAVLLGVATLALSTYLGAWIGVLAELVLTLAYLGYAQYTLRAQHEVLNVFVPVFVAATAYVAMVFYRYVTEGREKRRIRLAFEHYLHPEVISQVVDNPDLLRLGGERRHLAIMFTDIVNFTSRAEKTSPEALVNLLNTYTTAMTDLILESHGVVDKLMGDGIMAFWGTPIEVPNAARVAIDCGLAMLDRLNEMRRGDERFKDLYIGIGVHAGNPIAGNFGSLRRLDYTIIGDDVNFASRLEGLTRHFKVALLVSAETLREAGEDNYVFREIGLVKVKGKEDHIMIAEVICRKADLAGDAAFYQSFSDAIGLLSKGSWPAALDALTRLQEQKPTDEVARLCIEKIRNGHPPGPIIFEFETK